MDSTQTPYFAVWLSRTLRDSGLSGRQLAEKIGVNEAAVSRYKAGTRKPTIEVVARMAEALGVDPMRLAVTADVVPISMANGVEPLPLPPSDTYADLREALAKLPGITEDMAARLLCAFAEGVDAEGE